MKQVVLISGATSDIGVAVTKKLQNDYQLLLLARNEQKAFELFPEIPTSSFVFCDLSQPEESELHFKHYLNETGVKVNHFIHCAASIHLESIRRFTYRKQLEIFNVNFFSAVGILQALLQKGNRDSVKTATFISALWSIRGAKGNSIYAASKGALDSLVKSLALELAPQVRVNSILPGAILTNMSRSALDDKGIMDLEAEYPLGIGKETDVAELISFILSDKAKWITGQNYVIDGGRSCR